MKILHLIDSLNTGGAERMAVGYVNALAERHFEVYLWSTREEGLLVKSVHPKVNYRFLNRKGWVGFKALFQASKQVKKENIQLIHAHSTSYFFATLLKLLNPSIKLVWHDHFGSRQQSNSNSKNILVFCSRFFDTVFTVNQTLKQWHKKHLKTKNIRYIPNFVSQNFRNTNPSLNHTNEKTLVCLANLRVPKNHENLIKAFAEVYKCHPNCKLQLIGKNQNDVYAKNLKNLITAYKLEEAVSILGVQAHVASYLEKASIGILSSDMEGLPMSLLEYALSGLPVVCTDVGYCKEVVQDYGKVVPPGDFEALAKAILHYIENPTKAKQDAINLQKHVESTYTQQAVLPQVIEIYRSLLIANKFQI